TCAASRSASEYTATVRNPMRLAVRMTRHAISPRLAINNLWKRRASDTITSFFSHALIFLYISCLSGSLPTALGRGLQPRFRDLDIFMTCDVAAYFLPASLSLAFRPPHAFWQPGSYLPRYSVAGL